MIPGITIEKKSHTTVCIVNLLTDELKAEIRNRLTAICHGKDKVEASSIVATYRNTLKEFLIRYETKTVDIQKGMIGELLTHILLLKKFPNYNSANPYFNMEEGSIKKGFDLIIFDKECNELKIVEVKSGESGKFSADKTNINLLNSAKNDLKKRLNQNKTQIWLNAINGAKLALSGGVIKDEINRILEECYSKVVNNDANSTSKSVILVSVLYKNCTDTISINSSHKNTEQIIADNIFKEITVFSIQKETWKHIVEFLKEEATE